MGRAARSLYDALEQLHSGIPLNWSQVEDDPELIALAQLSRSPDITEWRGTGTPRALQDELFEDLASRLPTPKPKPVKAPPKSLAGFSEAVPVPIQAEEDIPPLSANALPWVGATLAAAAGVALVLWLLASLLRLDSAPTFTWLQLRQDGKAVTEVRRPPGWVQPACRRADKGDGTALRRFDAPLVDRSQAQLKVGFPISFLPGTLPVTPTYGFRLLDVSLSPCTTDSPDPIDPGMMVKLTYTARKQVNPTTWTATSLVVFQGRAVPLTVNVERGNWKRVDIQGARGIYWRGAPYVDPEGKDWIGDVSVLALESGDRVSLYVGQTDLGVDEQMLASLAGYVEGSKLGGANRPLPSFNMIQLVKDGKPLENAPTPAARELSCRSGGEPNYKFEHRYYQVTSFKQAQAYTGYQLFSLPPTGEAPEPYHSSVIDGAVRPCTGNAFVSADPGASAQLRYNVMQTVRGKGIASQVTMFQWRFVPATVDVTKGTWKEVQLANGHGVLWSGVPYHDPDGSDWSRPVNVLVFEREDYVITLIGHQDEEVTEDLLIALATGMNR